MGCDDESVQPGSSGSVSDSRSRSDSAELWYPGDGICPTESQFMSSFRSSFRFWSRAATSHEETSKSHEAYLKAFLDILRNVPPFFHNPPKDVHLVGGKKTPLVLKSSLHVRTADQDDCDQQWKSVDYLQCVGFPQPIIYRVKNEASTHRRVTLASNELRSDYVSTFCLAWSYILSCRWVEILQFAGHDGVLLHRQDDSTLSGFWEMIIKGSWLARLKWQGSGSCSPWMLRSDEVRPGEDCRWVITRPNSSLAFDILLDFCISEGLEREMLIAFTSVLLLPSRNLPPPKMTPPMIIAQRPTGPRIGSTLFHDIMRRIDSCLFLSATQDALDSLACSVFFDPSIPCNLVGSASLGIVQAFLSGEGLNQQSLLSAISKQTPHMSLLWHSLVIHDQASQLLNLALKRIPPISIVAAFITDTLQSFLQVTYRSDPAASSIISRAEEFQTSFYCRPTASVPWTPWPPFGKTTKDNLSLEVFAHCNHVHKPLLWQCFWILRSGEKVAISEGFQLCPEYVHTAEHHERDSHPVIGETEPLERESADEQSWSATSRLYNWHRDLDDGLWLYDGNAKLEDVRRLQQHPWIVDPFHDAGHDDAPDEENQQCPDSAGILSWAAKVRDDYKQDAYSDVQTRCQSTE